MRSFALLAALLALASASPIILTPTEGYYNLVQSRSPLSFLWQRNQILQQSPAQQAAQQISQQIQQAQIVNAQQQQVGSPSFAQDVIQSAVAQQTAQGVLQQALLARQGQTVQGIEQLEQQLNGQGVVGEMWQGVQQVSTTGAIKNLQKWLQIQQLMAPQILVNSQLTKTLEVVIQAQLAAENVNQVGITGLNSQVFQAKVQQLIDISNIKEIEVEILNQQAIISQLRLQQQLIGEQIQQTQLQQNVVSPQLQNAVVGLQIQGQQLTVQILARQLVIQQLQQALLDQQQQLQQDIQQVQGSLTVPFGVNMLTNGGWSSQYGIGSQIYRPYGSSTLRQSLVGSV